MRMIKNISKYINVFKRPKSLKMKAKDAYGSFKRKTIDTSEKVKKKYDSLHPYKKAAIEGFGKGLKYGTLAIGSIVVGKGAYNLATGNNKNKKKYKTTDLDLGKYSYKITSYK